MNEPNKTLKIRDHDSLTTSPEVTAPIKKKAEDLVGDLKVTFTGGKRREQSIAIVEISTKGAEELLKSQRIKIGWVNCRVRRRVTYGQWQANCKDPDKRQLELCIQ